MWGRAARPMRGAALAPWAARHMRAKAAIRAPVLHGGGFELQAGQDKGTCRAPFAGKVGAWQAQAGCRSSGHSGRCWGARAGLRAVCPAGLAGTAVAGAEVAGLHGSSTGAKWASRLRPVPVLPSTAAACHLAAMLEILAPAQLVGCFSGHPGSAPPRPRKGPAICRGRAAQTREPEEGVWLCRARFAASDHPAPGCKEQPGLDGDSGSNHSDHTDRACSCRECREPGSRHCSQRT